MFRVITGLENKRVKMERQLEMRERARDALEKVIWRVLLCK